MKNFFEEKKRSLKFKLAGPGRKLGDESEKPSKSTDSQNASAEKRVDSIEYQEKRSAVLAAAMQRSLGNTKKDDTRKRQITPDEASILQKPGTSRQISAEDASSTGKSGPCKSKEASALPSTEASSSGHELPKESKVSGVYFKCPTLDHTGEVVLPASEWKDRLEEAISILRTADPLEAAAVAIKSCNSPEKAETCILTISKYLGNLIEHPDNEKYKCIRMSNPKFTENVLNVKGGLELLECVGFVRESIEGVGEHLIYRPENDQNLERSSSVLTLASAHSLILDRDAKIFSGADIAPEAVELPDDFFDLTAQEVKREQQTRKAKLEMESMLMTKKMREMKYPSQRKRKAMYTRIRLRLPNDIIIQGTFSVDEKFKNLREFLEDQVTILDPNYNFVLTPSLAVDPVDEEKTFSELDMQPAVQLTLNIPVDKIALKY